MLEPFAASLTADTARPLANMKADPLIQRRIDELAAKANEGKLTSEERARYETYVKMGNVLAMIKARAKRQLAEENQG